MASNRLAFFDFDSTLIRQEIIDGRPGGLRPPGTPYASPPAKRQPIKSKHADPNPKNRLAFFDFDSTLIRQEIIDELAAANGKKEEVERLTRETMEGKHDFLESLCLRTSALAGLGTKDLERVAKKITFRSNFGALMEWLKANGFATAVISGSFENVLNRIEGVGRFDHVFANHLVEKEGILTGEVVAYVTDNKGSIAIGLQERLGIKKERCFAAGDGSTDIPVFKECGFSIAINGKAKASEAATVALETDDLSDMIPHLEKWLEAEGG